MDPEGSLVENEIIVTQGDEEEFSFVHFISSRYFGAHIVHGPHFSARLVAFMYTRFKSSDAVNVRSNGFIVR